MKFQAQYLVVNDKGDENDEDNKVCGEILAGFAVDK